MTYRPIPGVSRVIGVTGHARHGKDVVARLLLTLLPGAERFAFSDALAAECRVHHGMTRRHPALMQSVGMAWRDARPTVWLDALYGAIEDKQPDIAVITGVRFHDEAALVREMGGTLVRVVRVDADGRHYIAEDRDPSHRAEQQIAALAVDAELIARSGDMAGLERQVRAWVRALPDTAADGKALWIAGP